MASYNKVILIGNLTRDPEPSQTGNGHASVKFGIACNHRYKTESGEMKEDPVFVDCKGFGPLATAIAGSFKKGMPILVEGRLVTDKWTDKQTGQPVSKMRVLCEHFRFMSPKEQL